MSRYPAPGIAHLTLLNVPPPELVGIAAAAGFGFVGLRVAPAAPGEFAYPMSVGSPMLAETRRRMADLGVGVMDIEVLDLHPRSGKDQWRPVLATGNELGARFLNVVASDDDPVRLADRLAELTQDALDAGITPAFEPIPYRAVRSLELALTVVRTAGAGLLVDALHLARLGNSPADLGVIEPGLLPYAQLCDAPLAPPGANGDPVAALKAEARTARLPPGQGELPLRELLAALPPGIPVSAEAPWDARASAVGSAAYAREVRQSLRELLEA